MSELSIAVANQVDPAFRGDQQIGTVLRKRIYDHRCLCDPPVVDVDELEVGRGSRAVRREVAVEAAGLSTCTAPPDTLGELLARDAPVPVGIRALERSFPGRFIACNHAVSVFVETLKGPRLWHPQALAMRITRWQGKGQEARSESCGYDNSGHRFTLFFVIGSRSFRGRPCPEQTFAMR